MSHENRNNRTKLIFVVGVPRSGTTLTRVLLGSHAKIVGFSETPWITGAYGGINNIADLYVDLCHHNLGPVTNSSQISVKDVQNSVREMLIALVSSATGRNRATHAVFKTPDDCIRSDFLREVFSDAYFIHIRRDPRDVVISTLSRFTYLNNYGRSTPRRCIERWFDYEEAVKKNLGSLRGYRKIEYEELTIKTELALRGICDHIGVDFDKRMLQYHSLPHDLPEWEEGSKDVVERKGIKNISHYKDLGDNSTNVKITFNEFSEKIERAGYSRHLYKLP